MIAIEGKVRKSEWPDLPATPSPILTGLTDDLSKEYWLRFSSLLGDLAGNLSGQAKVEVAVLAARVLKQ
ncbi:MAG: hypothetical protein ACJAYU_002546 [Bradymonadia bacterium]|jgi:hypothetical protein